MKKVIFALIVFLCIFAFNLQAQTPMYYNLNNGTSSNSFPFNTAGGKAINILFLANEFVNPTPLPVGQQITAVYFRTSTAGTRVYTNLHILLAQDSSYTAHTSGVFYPGPYDTVFVKDTSLTSAIDGWMKVQLAHPFVYNPAKSLILFVGHCGATGTGGSVRNTSLTPAVRRLWSVGGCPFVPYASVDGAMLNFGVDVVPAVVPVPCSIFSSEWTTNYTAMPDPTNGSRVIPCGITINDTGYVFIMGGNTPVNTNRRYNTVTNTWDTRTALPVALATTTGVTVRDSIYIIGGYGTGGTVSTATYRYNPRTDNWATKTTMPTATMNADMVVLPWKDSLIICVGGDAGLFAAGQSTAVRVYNVFTDTWQNLTGTSLLPVANAKQGGAIVGDTIFTFGGYPSGVTSSAVYRGIITSGNPISITWSTAAPLPTTMAPSYAGALYRVAAATVKSMNKGIVLLGGANGTFFNGIAHLYNPCANSYTALTAGTGSAKNNLGATMPVFKDSLVYFCAGYTGAGTGSVLRFAARCYYCNVTGITGTFSNIPSSYSLNQNYPNPFNPVTKISYDIPKSGLVTLRIYDILGKEVIVLVNEIKSPGSYLVEFDASLFASGAYFYRLESNGFISTKKMVLIK